MAAQTQTLSQEIDRLLETYLDLLGQYDALRAELGGLQSSIQQHLARANFDAQRGIRYGADFYDARMQAVRRCHITPPPPSQPESTDFAFTVQHGSEDMTTAGERAQEGEKGQQDQDGDNPTTKNQNQRPKPRDPLRMFGILTPQSLRTAQSESIKMVEGIIPKLVSIDAQMKEVEIKIRRARKYRAKAEAAEIKGGENEKVLGSGVEVGDRLKEGGRGREVLVDR